MWSYQENFLTCIGGILTQSLFGDFQLSRKLFGMLWWDLNTKSFRRFAAIKNTYLHALVEPEHKIFSAIFSYQENLLTCIGGTWTQNLFSDLQRSRILMEIHWWDLNPKFFRWFSVIKKTFWHALVGPEHEIFSLIFSYQEHLFTCIDGTYTQNLFSDLQRSRILMDMQWWDLNPKSFRWFSAIKKTFWHALVGPEHEIFYIFLAICSYQEYILTCIGGTWTQNLFSDVELSRKLFDMHWWDLNPKSFRRFAAIKNTFWHALVGPEHQIFSVFFSYQENLLTCIGGTWTRNLLYLFGDLQLSRIHIDMHWWDLNTKSFQRCGAIKKTFWHALVGP